jgi:Legume lectin domain
LRLAGFRCAWIFFIGIAIDPAPAAIRFEDFASIPGLTMAGDAAVSEKVLRPRGTGPNQAGAAWFRDKQPVRSGFETTFQFQLTHQDRLFHGPDGFAFVLRNSGPAALGGRGSAGGFGISASPSRTGIPWCIAIFFDTARNKEEGDPSSNFIAIRTNGSPSGMRWPAPRLAFTPTLSVRLKDRKVHTARIV